MTTETYADRIRRSETRRKNEKDPVKSVVQDALDQMCHGRVAFGLRQLVALVGQETDPDYLGMIETVARRLK